MSNEPTPPDTAPKVEAAAPRQTDQKAEPEANTQELRCTLCGLRACWTG